jgi:hypothetical protein
MTQYTGLSMAFLKLKNIYSLLYLDSRPMILRACISYILWHQLLDNRGFDHDYTNRGNIE